MLTKHQAIHWLLQLMVSAWHIHQIIKGKLNLKIKFRFKCSSNGKESVRNVGDLGSIPVWGRSPGEGHGKPFQ